MTTRIAKFKHHQTPFVLAEKQTSSSDEFNQKLLKIQPKHWPDIPDWFSEACIKKYEEGFEPFWNKDTHSYVFMESLNVFSTRKSQRFGNRPFTIRHWTCQTSCRMRTIGIVPLKISLI